LKVVVIGGDAGLQKTLALQLQRQHTIAWIAPENIAAIIDVPAEADDEQGCLVIDIASHSIIRQTQPELFPQSYFERLIQHCAAHSWRYLLLSDCRVFAGGKQRHRETDKVEPNSVEGVAFVQREEFLRANHSLHMILRAGPLLASSGENVLTRLVALLRAGGAVPAASEPRFCPVAVDDLARVISAMSDQLDCDAHCWGTYHYNSSDATSPYEFAEAVLAAASQYWPLIDHVKIEAAVLSPWSGAYPQLNCHLIRDTFGIQQLTWRKAIPELLKQMHAGETS